MSDRDDKRRGDGASAGEPEEGKKGYGFAERDQALDELPADETDETDAPSADQGQDAVARLVAERDEHLADLKRLAAEFDNYRKRMAREREEIQSRASERVVKEILSVVDDLDRALEAAAQHEEAQLVAGVEMVRRQLGQIVAKEGVEEISTDTPFDPHVHEALTSMPADVEEGTILEVIARGYTIAGKVIRPARVIIARAPEGEPEAEETREVEEG